MFLCTFLHPINTNWESDRVVTIFHRFKIPFVRFSQEHSKKIIIGPRYWNLKQNDLTNLDVN